MTQMTQMQESEGNSASGSVSSVAQSLRQSRFRNPLVLRRGLFDGFFVTRCFFLGRAGLADFARTVFRLFFAAVGFFFFLPPVAVLLGFAVFFVAAVFLVPLVFATAAGFAAFVGLTATFAGGASATTRK